MRSTVTDGHSKISISKSVDITISNCKEHTINNQAEFNSITSDSINSYSYSNSRICNDFISTYCISNLRISNRGTELLFPSQNTGKPLPFFSGELLNISSQTECINCSAASGSFIGLGVKHTPHGGGRYCISHSNGNSCTIFFSTNFD